MANVKNSGNTTAQRAGNILVAKGLEFVLPTGKQKKNLVVAFAKRDKIVYGKAFDIIKLSGRVDLDSLEKIESKLDRITLYEIKSTARDLEPDFKGYIFWANCRRSACLSKPKGAIQVCLR